MAKGAEERLHFFLANQDSVALALHGRDDVENLVTFVIDLRDPVGKMLVEAAGKDIDVEAEIRRIEKGGNLHATGILVLGRELARKLTSFETPSISNHLAVPCRRGHAYVVVISSGGSVLLAPPRVSLPAAVKA